jgi:hypothetical protein
MNEVVHEEVLALARILTAPETTKASIEARVLELEGDALPKVVIRAREVQGFAKHVIEFGEQEMRLRATTSPADPARAAAVPVGGRWVDRGTGVIHRFEGDLGDWKVADPFGLRLALAALTRPDGSRLVTDIDIERGVTATYKPDHRVLNELAKIDEAVAIVIDDFRKKDRGPAHLREEKP